MPLSPISGPRPLPSVHLTEGAQSGSGTRGSAPAAPGWSGDSSFEPFKFLGEVAAEKKQVELELQNGTPSADRIARRYFNGSAEGPSIATGGSGVEGLLRQYEAAPASNKPSVEKLVAQWQKSPDGQKEFPVYDALDIKYTLSVHALANDLISGGATNQAKETLGTVKKLLSTSAFDWMVTSGDRRKATEAMSALSAPEFFWVVGQLRPEGKANEFFSNGNPNVLTNLTDKMASTLGEKAGLGEDIAAAVSYHLDMNWRHL